jgi:hypothetical protein
MSEKAELPASAQQQIAVSEHDAASNHDRETAHHPDSGDHEYAEKQAISARILARMRTAYRRLPASIPKNRSRPRTAYFSRKPSGAN